MSCYGSRLSRLPVKIHPVAPSPKVHCVTPVVALNTSDHSCGCLKCFHVHSVHFWHTYTTVCLKVLVHHICKFADGTLLPQLYNQNISQQHTWVVHRGHLALNTACFQAWELYFTFHTMCSC